jgi:hypothetical protein
MRMPTSKSVADSTVPSRPASSFTFVSTGLGDRAGTTAAALCRAASSGSRGQRTFMNDEFLAWAKQAGKTPGRAGNRSDASLYCTR